MLKKVFRFFSGNNFKRYLLVIFGSISWSLAMIRSGLCWNVGCSGGLGFWGANGHDGVWHISLAESLSRGSFETPIFAGAGLQNYHIGFDLILAGLHRITLIPIASLYFQILPIILSFAVGFLTYKFVEKWLKSEKTAWWSTFFVYFGGSLGFLVTLVRKQGLGGESMFWAQQAVSTLINPPFALSLVLLLSGLILLLKLKEKFSLLNFIFCVVFFGILIEIKVYAGLLALGGLLVTGIYSLVVLRKSLIIKIFAGALAISLAIYLPLNKASMGLITWYPFWFLESMIAAGDRLYIPKLAEAMLSYKNQDVIGKFVLAYGLAFLLFIVGNFGSRIIFLFRKIRLKDEIQILIYLILAAGIIIPTFFVQEGTPWNTIQFFYYSLFFASILAGGVIGKLLTRPTMMIYIMIVVGVLLTIPTTIFTLKDVYFSKNPPAIIPAGEVEALNFLSKEPGGVVLTYPFDEEASKKANPPRPLYLYTSTAYVSAFSAHQVYLEDQINLDIMQYPWNERRKTVEDFLNTLDTQSARNFLTENNIKYVYWLNGQHARIGDRELGMERIFKNEEVVIFKVN